MAYAGMFGPPVLQKKSESDEVRVYLAGKIGSFDDGLYVRNNWRASVVGIDYDAEFYGEELFSPSSRLLWIYIGPFFDVCGHGEVAGRTSVNKPDELKKVFAEDLNAIQQADVVFAFIDSLTCYATLFELGVAFRLGKEIWLCYHPSIADDETDDPSEFWFITLAASKCDVSDNPREVFDRWRKEYEIITVLESPIEEAFWCALPSSLQSVCQPQYPADPYRLDFAFPSVMLAVELDGHDYHSSRDQRTHDARRDRVLKMAGWETIRFTGSEIHADVAGCVSEVAKFYNKLRDKRVAAQENGA